MRVGLVAAQSVLHAAGFELEHAGGAPRVEAAAKVCGSSSGIVSRSSFRAAVLRDQLARRRAMTVSVSGRGNPSSAGRACSTAFMSYCTVTIRRSWQGERHELVERLSAMTMPAACIAGVAHHALQDAACSTICLRDCGSVLVRLRSSAVLAMALVERDVELVGNHLGEAVGFGVGQVRARAPTSRMTVLAPRVPKVMILATQSWPYLRRT